MAMELCLFDLDGTLLDTQADYLATDRYMRSVYNLEPLPLEVSMRLASAGLRAVIEELFRFNHGQAPSEELLEEAYKLNVEYYMAHIADHTRFYPGVETALTELKARGKVLAVVSNKNAAASEKLLKLKNLRHYFDLVAGDDENIPIKPAPDLLLKAMTTLGFPPEKTVMIGDNFTDMEAARRAGTGSIFFSNGYGSLQEEKADITVDSMEKLPDVII